jgi:cytoskeletal protein CcmA (bactofilin family)
MSATIGAIARAWESVRVTTSPGVRSVSGTWINKGEIAWYNSFLDAYAKPEELTGASQLIIGSVSIQGPVTVSGSVSISGPVTVTGSVSVSGSVSITGSVAVTGTVAISGTVTVTGIVAILGTVEVTGSVSVTGTVAISGTVTISGAVTITSGTVSITGSVTVTGSVSITGSVTVTGSVSITSGTVNIQTAAGVEVNIGKQTYTPITRTIQNDGGAPVEIDPLAYNIGKYFPSGMRGWLQYFSIYIKNSSGGNKTITMNFAPKPGAAAIYTTNLTISSAGGVAGWQTRGYPTVSYFWDYDSMFVWMTYTNNVTLYADVPDESSTFGDYYSQPGVGGLWLYLVYRTWYRVTMSAQAHYPVPVEGTVTVKNIDQLARLQPWYQPNFITQNMNYNVVGVAPHADTNRWTYTVPASRIAIVRSANCTSVRTAAPVAAGYAGAYIQINSTMFLLITIESNATVGTLPRNAFLGEGAILVAADTLKGFTYDTGNGGTYNEYVSANIAVFDT